MDNSRMFQRDGIISGLPARGMLPHFERRSPIAHDGDCTMGKSDHGCMRDDKCGCARQNNEYGCGGNSSSCPCKPHDKCNLQIAISSIEMQEWCNIYEPERGFKAGTIFEQLDLPFRGMRGARL